MKIEKYLKEEKSHMVAQVVDNFVRYFMGNSDTAISYLKQYQPSIRNYMKDAELHNLSEEEYNHYYEEFYKEILKVTDKWLSAMK
jgi:hypothetical protein